MKDYIYADLDDSREAIETANGEILCTRGAGTVAIEVSIAGIPSYIHLKNVDYCPEFDSNLLSLGVLEAIGFEFQASNGLLNVKDTEGDVVLQSQRDGTVYPLSQPKNTGTDYSPATVQAYKATKAQSSELWHQRLGHVTHSDLLRVKGMVKGVDFTDTESEFCESCTLGKQHKFHSTEPATLEHLNLESDHTMTFTEVVVLYQESEAIDTGQ